MAGTLSQAKEMFKSIDSENTGLIPRDELKILMQEIGGDVWAADNFDTMLESCGVAPESAEVKYTDFLEQLLGGEEEQKPEAPKAELPQDEKSSPPAADDTDQVRVEDTDVQDRADANDFVAGLCKRIIASMKEEAKVEPEPEQGAKEEKKEEAKPEEAKVEPEAEQGAKEEKEEEAKPEEAKVEPQLEEDAKEEKKEEAKPEEAKVEPQPEEEAKEEKKEEAKPEEAKVEPQLDEEAPAAAA